MRKIILLLMLVSVLFPGYAYSDSISADPKGFQKSNPDGGKYTFAKRYIASLEYFKLNAKRVEKKLAFNEDNLNNTQRIKALIDSLIMDNANLRIARNYVEIYKMHPKNSLMREVAILFTQVCDEQIELDNLEKVLLEKLIEVMPLSEIQSFNKEDYINAYDQIAAKKKDSLKKLLEASILVTKVLISDRMESGGKFDTLGITAREKEKLLFMLDEFYGKGYEGKMREGQSFLEASVVTIRDFLEGTGWNTLK